MEKKIVIKNYIKSDIDNMSYENMVALRRFAEIDHPYFQIGEISDYFEKVMAKKEELISSDEKVAISKKIGWEIR